MPAHVGRGVYSHSKGSINTNEQPSYVRVYIRMYLPRRAQLVKTSPRIGYVRTCAAV